MRAHNENAQKPPIKMLTYPAVLCLHLHPYFVYASKEGSVKLAHLQRIVCA